MIVNIYIIMRCNFLFKDYVLLFLLVIANELAENMTYFLSDFNLNTSIKLINQKEI